MENVNGIKRENPEIDHHNINTGTEIRIRNPSETTEWFSPERRLTSTSTMTFKLLSFIAGIFCEAKLAAFVNRRNNIGYIHT